MHLHSSMSIYLLKAGMNRGVEQKREEGHFRFSHPYERKRKESKSEKRRVNDLCCHSCDRTETASAWRCIQCDLITPSARFIRMSGPVMLPCPFLLVTSLPSLRKKERKERKEERKRSFGSVGDDEVLIRTWWLGHVLINGSVVSPVISVEPEWTQTQQSLCKSTIIHKIRSREEVQQESREKASE